MSIAHVHEDTFQAYVTVAGTRVSLVATTIDGLLKTLAQLGHTTAAQAPIVEKAAAKAEAPRQSVREVADEAAAEAAARVKATVDAVKPAAEPPKHTYDEIKAAILAMSKIDQSVTAKRVLAQFKGQSGEPCDHGNKLKLEDYAAFLAAAKVELDKAAAKVPA
jgi:DNA-binding transcriptional MocR family regulator